ncbi:group-specific protein, partial [Salmonella enterica subsp. enterica serovar Typhimurium]
MLKAQIDEDAVTQMYKDAIDEHLKDLDQELVFWDSKELKRRTCM